MALNIKLQSVILRKDVSIWVRKRKGWTYLWPDKRR